MKKIKKNKNKNVASSVVSSASLTVGRTIPRRCDGGCVSSAKDASGADDEEAIVREATVADEGAEDASFGLSSAPLWMALVKKEYADDLQIQL